MYVFKFCVKYTYVDSYGIKSYLHLFLLLEMDPLKSQKKLC